MKGFYVIYWLFIFLLIYWTNFGMFFLGSFIFLVIYNINKKSKGNARDVDLSKYTSLWDQKSKIEDKLEAVGKRIRIIGFILLISGFILGFSYYFLTYILNYDAPTEGVAGFFALVFTLIFMGFLFLISSPLTRLLKYLERDEVRVYKEGIYFNNYFRKWDEVKKIKLSAGSKSVNAVGKSLLNTFKRPFDYADSYTLTDNKGDKYLIRIKFSGFIDTLNETEFKGKL